MRVPFTITGIFLIGLIFNSCHQDDLVGDQTGVFWKVDGLTYQAVFSSAIYSDSTLSFQATSSLGHTVSIGTRVNGQDYVGEITLDDTHDNFLVYYINGVGYATEDGYSATLYIADLDVDNKRLLGSFAGELVKSDGSSETLMIYDGKIDIPLSL